MICCLSGKCAPTKEHERNKKSAQGKMLRHIVKTSEDLNIDSSCSDDESEDGKSYVSLNDQDRD